MHRIICFLCIIPEQKLASLFFEVILESYHRPSFHDGSSVYIVMQLNVDAFWCVSKFSPAQANRVQNPLSVAKVCVFVVSHQV
jgi:hypothetical protein